MKNSGWKYYNHAAIPTTPPHRDPNMKVFEDKSIWSIDGKKPLLARWTTDFDCGYETNWWYVIKDTPFVISELKAKRRYEINKGIKNFEVKEIDPKECAESIYAVAMAAYATYPESYRPNVSHDPFVSDVMRWDFYKVYGAYSTEDASLCGYACLIKEDPQEGYINFAVMKAIPDKERLGLNAAMVNKILADHEAFLNNGGYICDGARSIQHETAFQDYLEKYFGFRKAYCRLHIVYNPKYSFIIRIAYKCRRLLKKFEFVPAIRMANSLLKMEEINRNA